MAELGGLPARKVHCSVLADKAFRQTLNNYFRIRGQHNRIITDGSRVIDPDLKITEQEVVEVIHQGAQTLEEIQARLKVGVGRPEVKVEIEKLIEKHRGQESKPFCPLQKP
jgi:bacterioferritin-associated ferredoxin